MVYQKQNKNMKKEKNPITYQVDWIKDGWCYRTTFGVPKDALKKYRAIAKVLNEKLEISKETY